MDEISALLNDTIQKGERFTKRSKVDQFEQEILKSLTFNPYQPHQMNDSSPYYNPYMRLADGSFAPHGVEHWSERGLDPNEYITTKVFYEQAGINRERASERASQRVVSELYRQRFGKSEALAKAEQGVKNLKQATSQTIGKTGPAAAPSNKAPRAVPVGTVHTHTDGLQYKKVAEGQWMPVKGNKTHELMHSDPKVRQKAGMDIEGQAGKVAAVQDAIKQKQREEQIVEQATQAAKKEVMTHVRDVVTQLYGGQLPPEVDQKMAEAQHGAAGDGPKKLDHSPIDGATPADKEPTTATGKKPHSVTVGFIYNGQEYNRTFNVDAKSHTDAMQTIHDGIVKKLGRGVQLTQLSAKTPNRDEKSQQKESRPEGAKDWKEANQSASL
jgi:hypothetical protein